MSNEHIAVPYSNTLKCEVCNATISYPESLKINDFGFLVCQSFDCRRIMSQKSSMTSGMFQSHLQFQKKIHHERREKEAIKKKYIEEAKEREARENRRILQLVRNKNPQLIESNTYVVMIPTGLSTLDFTSSDRINSYKKHLIKIISEATNQTENSITNIDECQDVHNILTKVEDKFFENPGLRTISDKLCSMCKGGCCTSGKEHAYLSAISIKRYLKLHPELTAQDILEIYLSHISSKSIVGACINQTITGCALPKELRSDTCNGHYCDPLVAYQDKLLAEDNLGTVVAIQRAGTCWNSYGPQVGDEVVSVALIEEDRMQFQDVFLETTDEDLAVS